MTHTCSTPEVRPRKTKKKKREREETRRGTEMKVTAARTTRNQRDGEGIGDYSRLRSNLSPVFPMMMYLNSSVGMVVAPSLSLSPTLPARFRSFPLEPTDSPSSSRPTSNQNPVRTNTKRAFRRQVDAAGLSRRVGGGRAGGRGLLWPSQARAGSAHGDVAQAQELTKCRQRKRKQPRTCSR